MIAAVTLNPSLDYTMKAGRLVPGQTNRSRTETLYPGGKGLNVARVLSRLGMETVCWGFVAGFVGEEILRQLQKEGLPQEMTRLAAGNSRINVKLIGETETEINARGPAVEETCVRAFCDQVRFLREGDSLVLSGSLPPMDETVFWPLLRAAVSERKIRLIADMDLSAIQRRLSPCRPFLIKPNRQELESWLGRKDLPEEEIPAILTRLREEMADNVLLSLGGSGAFLAAENGRIYRTGVLSRPIGSTVGAGDSMVGGFLYGFSLHADPKEAFHWASACGNATAFSQGIADKQTIFSVLQELPKPEEVLPSFGKEEAVC